jgi:hypothetical protein
MRKPIFCAIMVLGLCCLMSYEANAQETYQYSQISYDQTTNTILGYVATEVDYYCAAEYNAYVEGYMIDGADQVVDSGYATNYYLAEVFLTTPNVLGEEYTLNSYHDVVATYYYVDIQKSPEGCFPCDGCNQGCYYYYENWYWGDPFGYSFVSTGGYHYEWWFVFGSGPPAVIQNTEYISLGSSSTRIRIGVSISVLTKAAIGNFYTKVANCNVNCPVDVYNASQNYGQFIACPVPWTVTRWGLVCGNLTKPIPTAPSTPCQDFESYIDVPTIWWP